MYGAGEEIHGTGIWIVCFDTFQLFMWYYLQIHDGDVRESVSLQTLCLGHVLAAQFLETNPSTMRLLDEWEFVKETQVIKRFKSQS